MNTPFNTINQLQQDTDFQDRLKIAAATLGISDPIGWVAANALAVAMLEEVNTKYENCLATCPYHSRPGFDPEVISDELLVKAVGEVLGGVESTPA